MSNSLDREGLFLAIIRDAAVSLTRKAELPQFVATFALTHKYDEETKEWDDWSEADQSGIGYFVLVTINDKGEVSRCMSYEQVQKAIGWDGESFGSLGAGDWEGKRVQIRVKFDEYEGKQTLKICWIDAEDAQIGLRKLDAGALKGLDEKYGMKAKVKPAGAPKPPKPPAPATPPKAKKKKGKKPATVAPPAVSTPPPAVEEPAEEPGDDAASRSLAAESLGVDDLPAKCTMDEAWGTVTTFNEKLGGGDGKGVADEILGDYWQTRAVEFAADTDNITEEEWARIRDAVLQDIGIPF